MAAPFPNLIPHTHQIQLHRLGRPVQMPGQHGHTDSLQARQRVLRRPPPDILLLLPPRPRPHRPLDRLVLDVHKALLLQLRLELVARQRINAPLGRRLHNLVRPVDKRGIRRRAAVVAPTGELEFLQLDPAAGFQVRPALLEEARPVVHAEDEHARVYKVELLRVDPLGFGVVDDEDAVGRDKGRLDGG